MAPLILGSIGIVLGIALQIHHEASQSCVVSSIKLSFRCQETIFEAKIETKFFLDNFTLLNMQMCAICKVSPTVGLTFRALPIYLENRLTYKTQLSEIAITV